jgi:transposase, IS5 family
MDLWKIFVLGQLRLGLKCDYDRLHNLVNNHLQIQGVLGIQKKGNGFEREELISYQNIKDNISLLDDETLRELNKVIVSFGHSKVFKKKDADPLYCKADSFVVESNIHYPTDYRLLLGSSKKCLEIINYFSNTYNIKGWRKINNWYAELKSLSRGVFYSQRGGGKNKQERVSDAALAYCNKAKSLSEKIDKLLTNITEEQHKELGIKLSHFKTMLDKHIDLVIRRLINKEIIPNEEKIYSIFEGYTELIKKGKLFPDKEFGKRLLILTDQFNLIVDYELLDNEGEREGIKKIMLRIQDFWKIKSLSLDKGFWKKEIKEDFEKTIEYVIMSKPGKKTEDEKLREEKDNTYKKLLKRHSVIESNINELENRGLDRCPDRSFKHFKRYISIGICAYNLHKIGNEILKQKQEKVKKEKAKKAA